MSKKYDMGAALFELGLCSMEYPDLRICQIIVNATGRNDPFYVTDDELYQKLMAYRRQGEMNRAKTQQENQP